MHFQPADGLSAVSVEWDATRYAEMLPKNPSKPGTKAAIEKEASLRLRYPPLNEVTASTPCIIVDMHGIVLTWYLPGILSDSRKVGLFSLSDLLSDHNRVPDYSQNAMLAAREKLRPSLKPSKAGRCWRDDLKLYRSGGEGPQGLVNLSPAWFPQGHDVSALANMIYFLAVHSNSGNGARIPTGFCELQFSSCIGLARCHFGIQCNFERNPGRNSPPPL
jgi:hypothetical protein